MNKKLRILINTNAPWASSGYAQQSYDLLPLIKQEGYEIAASCFYGLEGGSILLDGIKFYPKIGDPWGVDAMLNHAKDFKADVVFSLQDTWVLNPIELGKINRWIPITPIDHDPVPNSVYDRLRSAYRVVTYSKFGHEQLQNKGMHSTYIPHTVDTDIFKPIDKNVIRDELKIPKDVFLFGMVGANKDNPPRKGFQHAIDAFVKFHKSHPKSAMYFHTLLQQQGGFPIEDYVKFLGITDYIYHLQPYEQLFKVHRQDMKKIYSAFDVLVMTSENEGFGVPIIEAQACGVPVITDDFTSMSELIIPEITGELCKISYKKFTPLLSYVGVPDINNIYNAMEKIYNQDRVKMGIAAREFIIKNYDTKTVFKEKWVPFLEMIENEIYKK
jgi:glycosyltransferase involved in cell wall biosynthesis